MICFQRWLYQYFLNGVTTSPEHLFLQASLLWRSELNKRPWRSDFVCCIYKAYLSLFNTAYDHHVILYGSTVYYMECIVNEQYFSMIINRHVHLQHRYNSCKCPANKKCWECSSEQMKISPVSSLEFWMKNVNGTHNYVLAKFMILSVNFSMHGRNICM